MEDARQAAIDIIDYLTSWPGFLILIVLAFLIKGWPFLRMIATQYQENKALLGIDDGTLAQRFQVATSRSQDNTESDAATKYQALVRDENWDVLHRQIEVDDHALAADESGFRSARIGVLVAMGEIGGAVAHGGEGAVDRVKGVIDAFEERLRHQPDSLPAAVLAAEAHMEVGWLYRGGGTIDTVSGEAMGHMQDHFERAREILRPLEVAKRGSAVLAAANFRLAVGLCDSETLFHAARNIWADIDPSDPEMMGQVAFHLLPRWYGSYAELHRAALDLARRSDLGDSAYTMTIMSVAEEEPELVEAIDAERFVKGAFEWLEARSTDQERINRVASATFYLMLQALGARRKVLSAALRQLLETKMRTFIIDIWPDALGDIRANLALLFGDELKAGASVYIDENGCLIEMPREA